MTPQRLNPKLSAWLQRPEQWLGVLNLALAALAGWLLAQFIWQMIPAPESLPPPPLAAHSGQAQVAIDINQALSVPIFGVANQTPTQESTSTPLDAPDTPLNLTLTGIMAATPDAYSRALIKDSSNKQHAYGIDDDVPGNAKISAIHPDRVILKRGGRFETLRLTPDKTPGAKSAAANRIMPPSGVSADTVAQLKKMRQEIVANPATASQYFRIQPVYNGGQLQGYRVYPGRKRELFHQVGLKSGELLTAVNGVTLNDPARSLQLLGDLVQAGSLTLTLQNDGQSRTVNISLN